MSRIRANNHTLFWVFDGEEREESVGEIIGVIYILELERLELGGIIFGDIEVQHAWILMVGESVDTLHVGVGAWLVGIPGQQFWVGLAVPTDHVWLRSIIDDGVMIVSQVDKALPAFQKYDMVTHDKCCKLWYQL